ncbi:hypothetical protein SAMN05421544_1182 [Riemerella columbipharyngis]|uniref:Uncharacterized protein n=2 Tax=Riemerella columbipharyngis TaxID=1071918 RepID=A0A1G7EWM4_9FLAO|nr:hypothetical protein SAMN05421544_1182 [Riemerella columbipharyngis]
MSRLEEINRNLPDNDEGLITERKMRDCFSKTFDEIGEKLPKPKNNGNTNSFPFVVGVNEDGESAKLPAGDLGKNIGNTDMRIPEGVVRVLDATGAKLQLRGLEDKSNDVSFGKKLKVNDNGELAFSDQADIQMLFPDTITVNQQIPNNISQLPEELEAVRNFMKNLYHLPMQLVSEDMVYINKISDDEEIMIYEKGAIITKLPSKNRYAPILSSALVHTSFPVDKSWAFMCKINRRFYVKNVDAFNFGLTSAFNPAEILSPEVALVGASHYNGGNYYFGSGLFVLDQFFDTANGGIIIYTYFGDILTIAVISGSKTIVKNIHNPNFLGKQNIVMDWKAGGENTIINNMRYWIQP